ncbi:hypothetical protein [Intrasporangium sp. YIM S08009]|uniref:hypothetical protein n=1 Tax=Intrasporangium zincisolvens TaxID=3080018 RepID=UPI002B06208E|nr:hypothetical protein [Intrasporangium sp. YIM S08009]
MATRKTPKRTSSGTRRAASTRRRTTRTTGTGATRRGTRPGLPTTVGAALGTLAVTTLLDLSWPARIGLLVVVVVLGLGYVLWRHRAELTTGARGPDPAPEAASGASEPATPPATEPPAASGPPVAPGT